MSIKGVPEELRFSSGVTGAGAGNPEYLLWELPAPFARDGDCVVTERFLASEDRIDRLTDVVRPTLTFFPASGRGPHPAVLVCPGGGYEILAWNHEGAISAAGLIRSVFRFSAEIPLPGLPGRRARRRCESDAFHPLPCGIVSYPAGSDGLSRLLGGSAPDGVDCRPGGAGAVCAG